MQTVTADEYEAHSKLTSFQGPKSNIICSKRARIMIYFDCRTLLF